ncbi:helicase HerA domain-containing protein [Actinoplanes sp. HUAS TT8]|uniref:helicase HerA domain-containing protein n=1 Tax=Actinoplanes sp. HUAS TT8 TaxID=3447453 RepID=UPI003F520A80
MNPDERQALTALRLSWAPTPDDVWRQPPYHVDGLHRDVVDLVLDGVAEAKGDENPIGIALQGQRGTGKTHLLGTVRERVQAEGGYFFLVELFESKAFWRSTAQHMVEGFARPRADGETQLTFLLKQLAEELDMPRPVRRAVIGEYDITRPALDAFVDLLRKRHRQVGMECQDTARALVLQASSSLAAQDVGDCFLRCNDEEEAGSRAAWGMRRGKRSAQEIVRDVSRLLALTGPTVIAVDQIDLLIRQSVKSTAADDRTDWQTSLLLEQIAGGLMTLRENTRRTLSVVSCLPRTWQDIKQQATDTVQDRFREAVWLKEIPTAELARELVEKRFGRKFGEAGFTPSYPTWPIDPAAFTDDLQLTPRELLRTIDKHVRKCLSSGVIEVLHQLVAVPDGTSVDFPPAEEPAPPTAAWAGYDRDFDSLVEAADPAKALAQDTEDLVVPELLRAGLTAWIAERGPAGQSFSIDPPTGGKPVLHARLRQAVGGETAEDEEHWSFRAVASAQPIAALNRIRNAVTGAGLTEGVTKRKLFLLRTPEWSGGRRTGEVLESFRQAGGRSLPFDETDIKQLMALRELIRRHGEETLRPWFEKRGRTASIAVLHEALHDGTAERPVPAQTPAAPALTEVVKPPTGATDDAVPLGATADGSRVTVGLEALRRHTAIFAGSGSGKTVLIRRLVEECALRGVSAIVLDPNNDLARLGDRQPQAPESWWPGDAERAEEYHANTEVVVWTPRRQSGRPLSFQPLPDFAGIGDDPDVFTAGIDAGVAALAPHARADGQTERARLSKAVLREALTRFARGSSSELPRFIALLSDLSEDMTALGEDGVKLAGKMAQLLTAAMINDPLFAGAGAPVDPGELLTPTTGRRARISVISFVGLPEEQQRQTFVNQLQLALFAWIRRHPAGDRPLGGLFVMDEAQTFAPSGAMTACTHSTLVLASQARKYGLGLVFATQAPKGLHNRIPGNAATQFFGLLTSMAQIDAAQEIARAKGSSIADVGRLGRGEFYAAVEGSPFVRMRAPFCLSHHPKSPLTSEEVVDRAAA